MLHESSVERAAKSQSSWMAENPMLKRNKSLQKIMPKDNRRYKE